MGAATSLTRGAAGVAQQAELELLQGGEHVGKGRAVAQGTGFALHQCDVVLPIIHSMPPVDDPLMAGDHGITGHHADARRVQPGTHAISQHGGTAPRGRKKKGLSLENGGTTSHKTRFTPTCSPALVCMSMSRFVRRCSVSNWFTNEKGR